MQKKIGMAAVLLAAVTTAHAQKHRFDPPWNTPPQSHVMFTVPGIDNVPDLYGDINDPQLVVFFGGNQFMCIDDLLRAFKQAYPAYTRIFAETLPPGILAKQIAGGDLTIGNLRITLQPDVFTAGRSQLHEMAALLSDTVSYTSNKLAILVQEGNPKHIHGLKDLGRTGVRVSMPNPAWEGIAKQIQSSYVKAGGESLRYAVMETKVKDGSTYLTQIHHRETPLRVLYNESDAGPVWYSEAYYQKLIGNPVALITIPDAENATVVYTAGALKNAPHAQAARDFLHFLQSPAAKEVYKKYGFDVQ
ncbi:MAG TPA: substrate-binding domain-containing protein [Chitinophaga sp.]